MCPVLFCCRVLSVALFCSRVHLWHRTGLMHPAQTSHGWNLASTMLAHLLQQADMYCTSILALMWHAFTHRLGMSKCTDSQDRPTKCVHTPSALCALTNVPSTQALLDHDARAAVLARFANALCLSGMCRSNFVERVLAARIPILK